MKFLNLKKKGGGYLRNMQTNKLKKNYQYHQKYIKTNNKRHTTVYKTQHSQI